MHLFSIGIQSSPKKRVTGISQYVHRPVFALDAGVSKVVPPRWHRNAKIATGNAPNQPYLRMMKLRALHTLHQQIEVRALSALQMMFLSSGVTHLFHFGERIQTHLRRYCCRVAVLERIRTRASKPVQRTLHVPARVSATSTGRRTWKTGHAICQNRTSALRRQLSSCVLHLSRHRRLQLLVKF